MQHIRRIHFAYQESKKYHDLALFLYKWLEFRELKYLFKCKISRKRFCTHFKRIENYWLTVNGNKVFKCFVFMVWVVVYGVLRDSVVTFTVLLLWRFKKRFDVRMTIDDVFDTFMVQIKGGRIFRLWTGTGKLSGIWYICRFWVCNHSKIITIFRPCASNLTNCNAKRNCLTLAQAWYENDTIIRTTLRFI